jgi:hypothetical protein
MTETEIAANGHSTALVPVSIAVALEETDRAGRDACIESIRRELALGDKAKAKADAHYREAGRLLQELRQGGRATGRRDDEFLGPLPRTPGTCRG